MHVHILLHYTRTNYIIRVHISYTHTKNEKKNIRTMMCDENLDERHRIQNFDSVARKTSRGSYIVHFIFLKNIYA